MSNCDANGAVCSPFPAGSRTQTGSVLSILGGSAGGGGPCPRAQVSWKGGPLGPGDPLLFEETRATMSPTAVPGLQVQQGLWFIYQVKCGF